MLRSFAERDALILQWTGLLSYCVRRLWKLEVVRNLGYDDAKSAGTIGLVKAAERWDQTRGVKFNTYALTAIRRAIMDEATRRGGIVKIPCYLTYDAKHVPHVDPERHAANRKKMKYAYRWVRSDCLKHPAPKADESREHARKLIDSLTSLERGIMERYYHQRQPFAKIAKEYGITVWEAREVHKRVRNRLQREWCA